MMIAPVSTEPWSPWPASPFLLSSLCSPPPPLPLLSSVDLAAEHHSVAEADGQVESKHEGGEVGEEEGEKMRGEPGNEA